MNTQQVRLPIEAIVHLLKSLDIKTREKIFEEVFIECDPAPLSVLEKRSLKKAEDEYLSGETIHWPISE